MPHGEADLSQVWSVIHELATTTAKIPLLLVIKSTVPVGTCDAIAEYLVEKEIPFIDIVHNPEFLRQGNAVHDFFHPDRIVIGHASNEAQSIMKHLYEPFHVPIQFCDRRSAELIKYASNAFLAMKISYINMMAELSERIGYDFLKAGVGFGGSCFPKDIKALQALAKGAGITLPLIQSTEAINERQAAYRDGTEIKAGSRYLKRQKNCFTRIVF